MCGEFDYDQNLGVEQYYHQSSNIRRQKREHTPREVKVNLPYFYGKDNVEAYLDWEMNVEQILLTTKSVKREKCL